MDIVDLYDKAVAHLQTVCDDYRRIKAIQLARQRDIPFAEAFENVSSVMPILRDIDKELLRRAIRDPKDIQAHKAEVEVVKKEIEMMIDLVAKLLQEIETIKAELTQDENVRELVLEEIVRKPDFDPNAAAPPPKAVERVDENADLAEAAKEDEEHPAKDLTPVMHRLLDIKDLTQETEDGPVPVDLFRSTDDTGALATIVDPKVNKGFGRKILAEGTPVEWMFVDTWYTIGPFDNANRRNLHRKFPPETVVDLDATYVGKDGREIRWQWVQAHAPMVTPADPAEYASTACRSGSVAISSRAGGSTRASGRSPSRPGGTRSSTGLRTAGSTSVSPLVSGSRRDPVGMRSRLPAPGFGVAG
jgi:hypothetical protein